MRIIKNFFHVRANPPERKKKAGLTLAVVLISLFILVFSYFMWSKERVIQGVKIAGIPVGGLTTDQVESLIHSRFESGSQKKVILTYNKRTFSVVLGAIGIKPDFKATVSKAYQIGREGNIINKLTQRIKVYREGKNLGLSYYHNQATLDSFYRLLEASIAVEPVRSYVHVDSLGGVTYSPSQEGKNIAREKLTQMLENAILQGGVERLEIPIQTIKPALTESDIKKWKLDQVLGMFSTKFNSGFKDRVHNLKIASTAINNVIIYPGQQFSFNTWVGPRLSETGYKEAPVVLNGELVPGVGGGVCQVSTTLYNAVLYSNLKVISRRNHTLPSAYIAMGRDAAVVYDGLDFIFENTLSTPILITAKIEPPYIRVAILGEKKGWKKVSLATEVIDTFPFKVKETVDPTLKPDERVKEQDGKKGFKVRLWRTIEYQDGTIKKYLENTSIYPPQPEKYKIGKKSEWSGQNVPGKKQ